MKPTPAPILLALALGSSLGTTALGQDLPPPTGIAGRLEGRESGPVLSRLREPSKGEGGSSRAEASAYRGPLARAASELAAAPERATQAELDALLARTREGRSLWYAAPELQAALAAIGREGDPALRQAAREAAAALEEDAHLVELRRAAFAARAAGRRGVEIWSEITRRSVEFWRERPGPSEAEKYDEVLADVAATFNGPAAIQHLRTYQGTFGRLPQSDPHVPRMLEVLERRNVNLAWVGGGIDPTQSEDFRPAFNDGTNNQVFHTNFFVLLGFAAGKLDPKVVNLVNLKHELLDGGRSVPDWTASETGSAIGRTIRNLRDDGKGRAGLDALPTIIGGFSNHPGDFARPYGPDGPDYTGLTRVLDESMAEFEQAPRGPVASRIQRGLIRLFGGKD